MDEVTALALAARDGDRIALWSFVRSTWVDVARLVTAVAGHDLADDAARDTDMRAVRALPAYRGDGVLTEQAVGRLDVDRRTAFALTPPMGFDHVSAAAICGCPVGTIRSGVARARAREQLVADLGRAAVRDATPTTPTVPAPTAP